LLRCLDLDIGASGLSFHACLYALTSKVAHVELPPGPMQRALQSLIDEKILNKPVARVTRIASSAGLDLGALSPKSKLNRLTTGKKYAKDLENKFQIAEEAAACIVQYGWKQLKERKMLAEAAARKKRNETRAKNRKKRKQRVLHRNVLFQSGETVKKNASSEDGMRSFLFRRASAKVEDILAGAAIFRRKVRRSSDHQTVLWYQQKEIGPQPENKEKERMTTFSV